MWFSNAQNHEGLFNNKPLKNGRSLNSKGPSELNNTVRSLALESRAETAKADSHVQSVLYSRLSFPRCSAKGQWAHSPPLISRVLPYSIKPMEHNGHTVSSLPTTSCLYNTLHKFGENTNSFSLEVRQNVGHQRKEEIRDFFFFIFQEEERKMEAT